MSLRDLAENGVASLLDNAATILFDRGLAKGLRIDIVNGHVDLVAALALASGANEKELVSSVSITDFYLPEAKQAAFYAAFDVLDAILDEDPETWAEQEETQTYEVVKLFHIASERLQIAIV